VHFVHFADVIGCNNMLTLKVCKFLQTFGAFILFYFILHVREALEKPIDIGVDSSSVFFSFRAGTHTQRQDRETRRHTVTDATEHLTHAPATAIVGTGSNKLKRREHLFDNFRFIVDLLEQLPVDCDAVPDAVQLRHGIVEFLLVDSECFQRAAVQQGESLDVVVSLVDERNQLLAHRLQPFVVDRAETRLSRLLFLNPSAIIVKLEGLAVANIARGDPSTLPAAMIPPLAPACTASTMRGKFRSEFET